MNWKDIAIQKEILGKVYDRDWKYKNWLLPRFTTITRRVKIVPERIDRIIIGTDLLPQERELLMEMLFNREGAFAQTFKDITKISGDITPP